MLVEVDENLIQHTAQVISKDYIHISVIENIKKEIVELGYDNRKSFTVQNIIKIIDKHISGKEQ